MRPRTGAVLVPEPPGARLDAVLCFKYIRTVANDNTVHFNGSTMQLMPDEHRASYARAQVEVQERLDGSIVVAYRGRVLASEPAPPGPVTLRARNGRRPNGHSPTDVPGSGSNGAHKRHAGAEHRNGAKGLHGASNPALNQDQGRLTKEIRPRPPPEETTTA